MKESCVNNWDRLSETFNIHKKEKISPSAADNILIAWPVIIEEIGKNPKALKILDFGCGTGGLCKRLDESGYEATGIDPSERMIKIAKAHSPKIRFIAGGKEGLINERFDVITSIMVFQFIDDIESYIPVFSKSLNEKGRIIFAAINPDFVKRASGMRYKNLESIDGSLTADMDFGRDIVFKVYARTADQYKGLFMRQGFRFISEDYPGFTEDFVKSYGWRLPYDVPEFLIMSFQKN
jgi:2-polyprenyl-3-methyl-5-hydroxy-6-metoxy-1,4-benzoquinol methylase